MNASMCMLVFLQCSFACVHVLAPLAYKSDYELVPWFETIIVKLLHHGAMNYYFQNGRRKFHYGSIEL